MFCLSSGRVFVASISPRSGRNSIPSHSPTPKARASGSRSGFPEPTPTASGYAYSSGLTLNYRFPCGLLHSVMSSAAASRSSIESCITNRLRINCYAYSIDSLIRYRRRQSVSSRPTTPRLDASNRPPLTFFRTFLSGEVK
jgi:hypothetical protein